MLIFSINNFEDGYIIADDALSEVEVLRTLPAVACAFAEATAHKVSGGRLRIPDFACRSFL
jgi:hypothetical protein